MYTSNQFNLNINKLPFINFWYFFFTYQVDEAVAVLQAHQAKEAAQKAVNNPTGVPSV